MCCHTSMALKKYVVRFITKCRLYSQSIIPPCFNRSTRVSTRTAGHSPTCVNTPPQLDIIVSIPAPSGPSSQPFAARNQANSGLDCKRLSSWNGRVGSGTKLLTKCSFTSALCPTVLKLPPPFASIGALKTAALDLDVTQMPVECAHHPTICLIYDALLSMRSIESQQTQSQAEVKAHG